MCPQNHTSINLEKVVRWLTKLNKKRVSILSLFLAMIVTISLAFSVSAETLPTNNLSEKYEVDAASRVVSKSVYYSGVNVNPPKTYYYSDSLGYRGNIPLSYVIRDYPKNQTIAVYVGTVYCYGTCPLLDSNY